jgi:SLT domain-containing protein
MPNSGIDQLHEPLRSIVLQILAAGKGQITAGGWRSHETQAKLYYNYIHGIGGQAKAARPGTSHHETGDAVDLMGPQDLIYRLASQFGLVRTVPGESWHYELGNGVKSDAPTPFYNLNGVDPNTPNETDPQEVLANRMQAVLSIIGLDHNGDSNVVQGSDPGDINEFAASPGQGSVDMASPTLESALASTPASAAQGVSHLLHTAGQAVKGAQFSSNATKAALQAYAHKKMQQMGMPGEQIGSLIDLWNRESGWNPNAQNPTSTAFGIAQFLNGTWGGTGFSKTNDPYTQIDAGLTYIKHRFGNPAAALSFWNRNHWY